MSKHSNSILKSITRYPGIPPFSRDYQEVFYGRTTDIARLYKYLNVNNLVVLHGKSGLGKSSLLNAGLLPEVEERQKFKTVLFRFGSFNVQNPVELRKVFIGKIKETYEKSFGKKAELFLSELGIAESEMSIWQHLKALEWAYRKEKGLLLVLDQFEEVFTYDAAEVEQFGKEFSEVVNNRMPKDFRNKLYKKAEADANFLKKKSAQIEFLDYPPALKILIGIRSDRLSLLDRFSTYLPNILKNNYELHPLDTEQAELAIVEPAIHEEEEGLLFQSPPFEYEPRFLETILNYLSKDENKPVEPFLLQIVCQHIETWVMGEYPKDHPDPIVVKEKDIGNLDSIARRYYVNVILGKDEKTKKQRFTPHEQLRVRYFIESNLIDPIHRNRISLDKTFAEQKGITEDLLQKLVDARIIREEQNTVGGMSYELSHDTLIDPVLQSAQTLGNLEGAIEKYYTKCVNKPLQKIIETHFINPEGLAQKLDISTLEENENEAANQLIKDKIVRSLSDGSYELYLMFVAPALKLRAKEKEKKLKQAVLWATIIGFVALFAIAATIYAFDQSGKADAARQEAETLRGEAEQNAKEATDAKELAVKEKKISDSLRILAEEAQALSEKNEIAANLAAQKEQRQKLLAVQAQRDAEIQRAWATHERKIAITEKERADSIARITELQRDSVIALLSQTDYQEKLIEVQPFLTRAKDVLPKNPTAALRIAQHAYELHSIDSTRILLYDILGDSSFNFFKVSFSGAVNWPNSHIFSPDEQFILVGNKNNTAILWNLKGEQIQKFIGHSGDILSTDFSPNGQFILTASRDSTAILWNLKGEQIQKFIGHSNGVLEVVFSPNGQFILTGSSDGTVFLWNLEGKLIQKFIGHKRAICSLAYSPNEQFILTASEYGTVILWSLNGEQIHEYKGLSGDIWSANFSPNGQFILAGSNENIAILWNLEGNQIENFVGHVKEVYATSFSTDGQSILTGSKDGTVILWNLRGSREQTQNFIGHERDINSIAFSRNWKYTLTGGGGDDIIKVWNTFPSSARQKIIEAHNQGKPFSEVKDLIKAYLQSDNVAQLTGEEKEKYGVK